MLSRQNGSYAALKRCWRQRLLSHRPYSSKVRAFPFVVSKEQAIKTLSTNTAYFTGNQIFSTWLNGHFPGLMGPGLQPKRLQLVYYPTWIIDAEVGASLWLRKEKSDTEFIKDSGRIHFGHSAFPGNVYSPLSSLNYASPKILDSESVPWSESLLKQQGEDVLCMPFSHTPFPLIDAAHSMSLSDGQISEILRVEPSSVTSTMTAAYPVLIPLYLAQFDIKTVTLEDDDFKDVSLTAFMEAGTNSPRVMVELVDGVESVLRYFDFKAPTLLIRGEDTDRLARFTNLSGPIFSPHATPQHRRQIARYLDRAAEDDALLAAYRNRYFPPGTNVQWDDVRIRPFTLDERSANIRWLKAREDLLMLQMMRDAWERMPGQATKSEARADAPAADEGRDEKLKWVCEQVAAAEKAEAELKPAWLSEYELQQRLLQPAAEARSAASAEHPSSGSPP